MDLAGSSKFSLYNTVPGGALVMSSTVVVVVASDDEGADLRHTADLPDFVHTSDPMTVPICDVLQGFPADGFGAASDGTDTISTIAEVTASTARFDIDRPSSNMRSKTRWAAAGYASARVSSANIQNDADKGSRPKSTRPASSIACGDTMMC